MNTPEEKTLTYQLRGHLFLTTLSIIDLRNHCLEYIHLLKHS